MLIAGVGATCAAYFLWPNESRSAPTYGSKPLSPTHFTPAKLVSSEISSIDTKILTLAVPPELLPMHDPESLASIWSIYIKDDDIQVERPYTPLEGVDEKGHMKFWVKKYEKGEVGRWLHSKTVGDDIEVRGPMQTWRWKEDVWDEVIMISGGTGITPFYQLLHNTFSTSGSNTKTRFTLLHSSRTPSELPPSEILGPLLRYTEEMPDFFSLRLFVDSSREPAPPDHIHPRLTIGRIGRTAVQDALQSDEQTSWWRNLFTKESLPSVSPERRILFLVCGPEQSVLHSSSCTYDRNKYDCPRMINAIAGPYGRNFSQGEVGGILGEMGYRSHQVRKL
ncbi:riboflavin synthase domain-like protein [Leucogyrophana mollusca]|uniref:Riboflavin synthase domain-like protein n=1 Tax=Leucogyrophana mollusca TaxID=85980 RepID=A0ACB8BY02_9AGAM|nr:riboflavin synthase domain-like protein [Leucogyrophana mollusca]